MLRRIGPLIALTLLTGCSDALGLEEGEVLDMVGQWSLEMRWPAGSKERCSASVRMAIEEQHVPVGDSMAFSPLTEVFSGVTMEGRAGCDSQTPFEIEMQPGILSGFVTRIEPFENRQRVIVNFCIEARYLGRSTAPERPGRWIACGDGVMWKRSNLEGHARMTFHDDGPISFDESYGSLFTLRRR